MFRVRRTIACFILIFFAFSADVRGDALQSAFLLRSSPRTVEPATRADRIAALQRHFDQVLSILESQTDASITESLERLEAARGTENVMPPMIRAAKAYCTEQEICDVLREVMGAHADRPEF